MLQYIVHDTVNDIAVIKTSHMGPDYHVRYGLQVTEHEYLEAAMLEFSACQRHAMRCEGLFDDL